MPQQYLSTDPHAGTPAPAASGGYLSIDPHAGQPAGPAMPDALFSRMLQTATAPPPTPDPTVQSRAPFAYLGAPGAAQASAQNFKDAGGGIRAGAARTVFHGGDLVRRAVGANRIIDTPDVQAAMTPPPSPLGHGAMYAEQAAEFMVPLARVSQAVSTAPLLARMAAEGSAAAGVAGVQSGGDPGQMAMAGTLGAAAPPAGALVRGGVRMVRTMAAGAHEGGVGGAVASVVRSHLPAEPRRMIVQALKPRSTNTGFEASLESAMPELKATEQEIGRPIAGVDDLLEATKAAKRRIWSQYERLAGPLREMHATVDLSPVADAVEASIPRKVRLENPAAAERLGSLANVYRSRFSIDDAEQLLKETNAELDGFYAKYPTAQRSAITANPEIAHTVAQAKALREALYAALDGHGEGAAARELKRRYGALSSVEEESYRRANVAKRQQPESLSEQIGKVRAAADMARGTWRVLHGDVTGVGDVMAARAGRATASYLKEQQTTDALIRRAFEGFDQAPSPVAMPEQPRIAGLLGRGPVVTPAPADRSFVRSVPAEYPQRAARALLGPAQTQPRALPSSGRIFSMPGDVAPVPPDPSGGRTIPAAPLAHEIDPTVPVKYGGVRVSQYAGDPNATPVPVVDRADVRQMLERMRDDLRTFSPTRGRMVRGDGSATRNVFAPGDKGSTVGDDVRVISEQNVGNSAILRAIDDLLAGKRPTNRLHTASLDAALGYLEKRSGYRGPVVPSRDEISALTASGDDDGFDAFSRYVDELSDEEPR